MSPAGSKGKVGALLSRRWVRYAMGVVALALVITVGSALAVSFNKSRVSNPEAIVLSSPASESQKLYDEAQSAQASGDTTQAIVLLNRAVALNPANSNAKTMLAQIKRSKSTSVATSTPPGGSGSQTPTSAPVDTSYLEAVPDVAVMLPPTIKDYRLAGLAPADKSDVEAPYEPASGSANAGKVSLMVVAVHDFGTAAAANEFVNTAAKAYPKNVASVKIGNLNGKFGTDGRKVASVSFARGRFAFEVSVTVPGGSPESYKSEVLRIAAEIPAAR